ncbi:hypothetical protein [Winogradskyella sp.]|uniref:hypothetical protein n=1 Tax=Winogradskyella sp. TaxID=1883156 RepID=UPI003BAB98CB
MDLPKGFHREVIESKESQPQNISNINDIVSTEPLNPGGASFRTNVLIQESSHKLVYKPYIGVALFCFIFLAIGIGVLFVGIYPFDGDSKNIKWLVVLVGLIFTTVGSLMFYNFYKPRVFDKRLGIYYSAYNFKSDKIEQHKTDNYISLKRIIAVQIIGENIKGDDGHYKSFELNLVLDDKSRKNVIDHGNLKSIIDDAHVLSDFLDVPIWHAKSPNQ